MTEKQTYSIRMHPEIMQSIKLKAVEKNSSISGIIETAIKKYFEV